jgi:lipopolysaccharide biosynthesis regulator YciM
MKGLALVFTAALLLAAHIPTLRADDGADNGIVVPDNAPVTQEAQDNIDNYGTLARSAAASGDMEMSEKYFTKLLDVNAPDSAKKKALFEMFECYASHHIDAKAIAVGERIHQLFPTDTQTPEMLLSLGRIYRSTGAFELATARFYNVLNATLRIDPSQFSDYQAMAKQAQFEIAETFVDSGDYKQAGRIYSMLDKLNLSSDQRAHAEFQKIYCSFLTGQYLVAVNDSNAYLHTYASSPYAAQCQYILSIALKALGRSQEATDATVALLRMEKKLAATNDNDTWTYWQRKTGNQLANGFYQEGDFLHALTIYQAMARLSDDPAWQWPVVYQVGLCFEHLGFPDRADEAYKFISTESDKAEKASKTLDEDLKELTQLADWRAQHIEWKTGAQAKIDDLLGPKSPAYFPGNSVAPAPTPSATSDTQSASSMPQVSAENTQPATSAPAAVATALQSSAVTHTP